MVGELILGTTAVAILSIVIQIVAAGFTLPLVKLTRPRWMWVFFGVAIALLAVARALSLTWEPSLNPATETIYLLLSVLLLAGVLGMRPLCRAYHTSIGRMIAVQRELAAARRRLGYVLDSAPVVVFAVDANGVFTLSEGRGLEGLGLKPGEVVGLSVFDLYKDNPDIISSIRRSLAGEEVTAPIDVIDLSYEVHYSPIRDDGGNILGVFGVAVDVSRRRRSETQLRATKERFRALVETISDLVWEIDPDGVYTYVGPKVRELLGYEPDELIGRTPFDLMPPEDAARNRDLLRQSAEKRSPFTGLVNTGRHKDGRLVVLESSGVPVLDDDGNLVGYRGIDRDITTRMAAQDALRASERRLNLALVAANMGTWDWNIETNRVTWSQKAEELFAIEKGSFDGKYETYFSLIHPEDRDHVQFAINAALEGRVSPFRVLHRIIAPDDETRWLEGIGQVIRNESGEPVRMLGVVSDVTDRELADRQLREEKETAQRYFDTAGVIMLVIDKQGTIELINRMGTEILGHAEDDIVGKNLLDFVPEASKEEARRIVTEVTSEEIVPPEYFEVPATSATGDERIIAWHSVAIRNDDGEIVGVLSSGLDVTEKRRAELAKQELEDQLRHSQRMETIGTLAGGIAHDFNNILTPILGYADIAMEEAGENKEVYDCLDNVVKAAHRAKELVEQILLFSKNVDQEASPIHLHLIVREGLKFVRASLPTTIEIQQNINIDSGAVLANSAQLHQVLVNLCTNAAYAMRDSGGVLRVSLEPVEVDAEFAAKHAGLRPGPYACLTVSDTGRGMDQQTVERIFEPFFTTKADGEGTGLGLPVVQGIVSAHGGHIVVDSEHDRGTTVTVYLPRTEPVAREEEVDVADPTGSERVLFVDDEPEIVEVGKQMLERLGYQVTTATNGAEALAIIRENPDALDVVVSDQTMPRKTGLDFIRELREFHPGIPVILMTGYSDTITPEKLDERQVNKMIMKPLEGRMLGTAIRQVLDASTDSGED